MSPDTLNILLFVFGAAVGSFINVLGYRYSERKGFKDALSGRSKCPHCKKRLTWLELIPIVSFVLLRAKCKKCKKGISWRYPTVELLAGLVALLIPMQLGFGPLAFTWIAALWVLLLISIIDLRLSLIPNGLVVSLAALGISQIAYRYATGLTSDLGNHGGESVSFLGHYYLMFRFGLEPVWAYAAAALFGLLLFGGIYFFSKGKAMGLGDVKLALALGTLLVLPDMILAMVLSFIVGSIVGLFLMRKGDIKFKSAVPFGPYMAIGVTLVFFFGYDILNAYFKLFGLI